jgi:hypothetical protein
MLQRIVLEDFFCLSSKITDSFCINELYIWLGEGGGGGQVHSTIMVLGPVTSANRTKLAVYHTPLNPKEDTH